jgi:SAM-dependent methyltransferase
VRNSTERSNERLRFHYEVEKELAGKLRNATKSERMTMYSSLYDELFRRVEDHPQLTIKDSDAEREIRVNDRLATVERLLRPDMRVMELGPGDCAFSFAIAPRVAAVFAIDVSNEITRAASVPGNFRLILSDGTSVPVEDGSIDLAYSDQLMEHLHPDDALEQLANVVRALRPGGAYFCRTPNRLSGPHDVSGYFGNVAVGFHLREYTLHELSGILAEVGLRRQRVLVGGVGHYLNWPLGPTLTLETILQGLPVAVRRSIASSAPGRAMLGVRILAFKDDP